MKEKRRKKKISVIIPAYNEEKRIYSTLLKIKSYLSKNGYLFEIIVVDDGSRDKTAEVVKRMKDPRIRMIGCSRNKGKGYAVRKGMLVAKHNLALFCDADLSTPIEELGNFAEHIKNYDIIIGSRVIAGHRVTKKQPPFRVFLGVIFSKITKMLVPLGIADTQCGFKLFKNCKNIFKKQTTNGFAFDVEILFLAKKQGMKILELPVLWRNAEGSKLSPVKDSLRMFRDVIKVWVKNLLGGYN